MCSAIVQLNQQVVEHLPNLPNYHTCRAMIL
jgi:hypothetical protein